MPERLTASQPIDFIIPDKSDKRRETLLPLLDVRPPRSQSSNREAIEAIPQPAAVSPDARFDYTYDQLVDIAHDLTPGNSEDIKRVARYALIWSGMKIDDSMISWAAVDHGYESQTRLPRVTLPVDNKRLSIRAVPDSWEDSVHNTPFTLQKDERGVQIVASDSEGNRVEIARPVHRYVTESVQTLAYLKEQRDGTKNITINPLQRCPQKCEFCCRAYHDMTMDRKKELINLSPDEMARYLKAKFPKTDWKDVSGITVVTGDFQSDHAILDYMQGFVESMDSVTSGDWSPISNSHQDLAVSTHLLESRESMERAKELGMKKFMYTVEMSDDDRREEVMYVSKNVKNNAVNKGHTPFKGALGVLETAIDVFGVENVEPVLVVGLDPIEKTKQSLDKLRELKIRRVSRALVNIYNMNQFSLMRSGFEGAVEGMQYARDLFGSAHSRVVNGDNPTANTRELYP